LPWWRRLLDALLVGTKMCVMFSLMSVLWIVMAVPTIDQHLHALFSYPWRGTPSTDDDHQKRFSKTSSVVNDPNHKKSNNSISNKKGSAHRSLASVLRIREDDDESEDDNGALGEWKKPRLNGSQELKQSEEGDNNNVLVAEGKGNEERPTYTHRPHPEDEQTTPTTARIHGGMRKDNDDQQQLLLHAETKTKRKRVRWSDESSE
jgi:hypothetical protein